MTNISYTSRNNFKYNKSVAVSAVVDKLPIPIYNCEQYLISNDPHESISHHANELVYWANNKWQFRYPIIGEMIIDVSTNRILVCTDDYNLMEKILKTMKGGKTGKKVIIQVKGGK